MTVGVRCGNLCVMRGVVQHTGAVGGDLQIFLERAVLVKLIKALAFNAHPLSKVGTLFGRAQELAEARPTNRKLKKEVVTMNRSKYRLEKVHQQSSVRLYSVHV